MNNKNILLILTAVVSALCLYYLSFTFISNGVQDEAESFATNKEGKVDAFKKQAYLDSVWTEPVFDLGFASYTYKEVKANEIKLGLDLLGGMNVTMEVAAGDIIKALSNGAKSTAVNQAAEDARKEQVKSATPFVDLFFKAWQKNNSGPLAAAFAGPSNRARISFNSSDDDVLKYLNEEVNSTIERSFEILRTRIDKFGVTQPNIQRLQGSNRILIELPGIDNPERVRKLLQGVAKLEFLEEYDPQKFGDFFKKMDELLTKEENLAKAGGKAIDLGTDSTAAAASTDSTTSDSSSKALASNDSAAKKKAEAKNDTSKAKNSTLISKLFVPLGQNLGANVRDTAKVNRLFARPEIRQMMPNDLRISYDVKPILTDDGQAYVALYALKTGREGKAPLEGDVITDARPDFDPTGKPEVSMQMNSDGARAWKRLTAANIKKRIAIVLDNAVYSIPTVQNEIPNGSSSISGSFSVEEAKDLANVLKAGKLPVPARIVEEVVVGPTLGKESIQQGLLSILIGFLTIIVFMVAYYSNSGWIADAAVMLNVFLILGMLVPIEAVLTLPGIAGIVLTIGMAVDANVLINERVKEEIRAGKPLGEAVANGYKAASTSIWDANLTTLIAGLVLMYFGSGPVQGFATTLVIGIATSLFTSVYITRIITEWRISKGATINYSTGATANLFRNLNFDFVGKRKLAYIGSSVFIAIGIAAILIPTMGLDYAVDFNGGYTYVVRYDKDVATTDVRQALSGPLTSAPEVKTYGSGNVHKITTDYLIGEEDENAAQVVQNKVEDGLKTLGTNYEILSSSKVGPTVARDIKEKSIVGILIAMAGIFGYIWLRFNKWEYAMGATIAVIHDTMVILSLFALLKDVLPFSMEIDQNFIAAVLTIAGYSVNDTVVIFDRIRETLRQKGHETDTTVLINQALNYTFSRTIVTASTVLIVVMILLFFGGESVRGMSFALLIGVITGTYSTVYIAVPFVIDASKRSGNKEASSLQPAVAVSKGKK